MSKNRKIPLVQEAAPLQSEGKAWKCFSGLPTNCVCPGSDTHMDGRCLGLDALLGGWEPESALPRLTPEVPRSQGTPHPTWKCQATRSPLYIFCFNIWVTRQFRLQILSEAMHISLGSKKKHTPPEHTSNILKTFSFYSDLKTEVDLPK